MKIIYKNKFTIITAIFILIVLLMPTSDIDDGTISFFDLIPFFDKIVHCCIFGFLSLVFATECFFQDKTKNFILKNIIILLIFAVLTEVLQKLTGYRTFDIFDIFADTVGFVTGTFIVSFIIKKKFTNHNSQEIL
ncbi:MAG: VanZ family protein [Clostridia bacterium]